MCCQWFVKLICSQESVWTDQTCSTKSLYPTVTPAKPLRSGRWITSWLYKEYRLNIQHIHTTSLQSCGADDAAVIEPTAVADTEGGSLTAASEARPCAPPRLNVEDWTFGNMFLCLHSHSNCCVFFFRSLIFQNHSSIGESYQINFTCLYYIKF